MSNSNLNALRQSRFGSEIIPSLKKSYKCIDTRGVFLYPESEKQWNCIFLKIIFTNKKRNEVEKIHNIKKSIIDFDTKIFQLKCECKDIEEIDNLLAEIIGLRITIDGLSGRLLAPDYQNLVDNNIDLMENNTIIELCVAPEQKEDYSYRLVQIDFHQSPKDILHYYNFDPKSYSIFDLDSYVNSFLDTVDFSFSNRNGIIIFPVYCRIVELSPNEKKKYASKIEIDPVLLANSKINYTVKNGNNIRYKLSSAFIDTQNLDDVSIIFVKIPDMNIGDYIHVEVQHNAIGLILSHKVTYDQVQLKSQDSLVHSVFDLFNASDSLYTYIYSTANEKQHLASIVWLLENLDFNCIPLGLVKEDDERIKDKQAFQHAADIIAYNHDKDLLLIIDITQTSPPQAKIQKISNTANYINSKITFKPIPVIISSVDCTTLKPTALGNNGIIIDKLDIDNVIPLIQNGRIDKAKELLLSLLS